MRIFKFPLVVFFALLAVIALLALVGPEERSLGANVRLVYLHGAWVMSAEAAFGLAAAAGLLAFVLRRADFHAWSAAWGRAGTVFWVSYLPLSMLAMQANWNGLFLAEPRFRLALSFAVAAILLQAGLWLLGKPGLISATNLVFVVVLRVAFSSADNIMHPPPSPIFGSGLWGVISFFVLLNLLAFAAAFALARWFKQVAVA
jgi:hypothetical protein